MCPTCTGSNVPPRMPSGATRTSGIALTRCPRTQSMAAARCAHDERLGVIDLRLDGAQRLLVDDERVVQRMQLGARARERGEAQASFDRRDRLEMLAARPVGRVAGELRLV